MEREPKTLLAVPSGMEWNVFFKKIPHRNTVQKPHRINDFCDAACVGIGLVDFVDGLSQLICNQKYKRVVIVGVAGALPHSGLVPESVVRVDEECLGDIGYWNVDKFTSYVKKPRILKATSAKFAPESIAKLPGVRGISVNTMTSSRDVLEFRAKFYKAKVEAMEGASAFVVANAMGVQVFEVRTISNFTGDCDESKWNLKQSLKKVQREVLLPFLGEM